MRHIHLMAACSALALMRPDDGAGDGGATKSPAELKAEADAADANAVTADAQAAADDATASAADAKAASDAATASASAAAASAADAQRDASKATAALADAQKLAADAASAAANPVVDPTQPVINQLGIGVINALVAIDQKAQAQGHSLTAIIVKAAANAFGIDVTPDPAVILPPDPLNVAGQVVRNQNVDPNVDPRTGQPVPGYHFDANGNAVPD